jgi:hypothetical protein
MPRTRALPIIAASAIAMPLAGCGITNPYASHTDAAKTTAAPSTTPWTPPPATNPQPAVSFAGSGSPQAALERYATADINWTSATLGADQRHLASISLGAARAMALQAAATYGAGSQLQKSRVTNSGQVTSIAAGQGPLRGRWVITTQEHTSGSGDYAGLPAQAHVYYARVQHTTTDWVITQWSPQT